MVAHADLEKVVPAADAQVRAGCFDCLVSAFQEYDSLRPTASVADEASIGAARSAALLAIRERELGTEDSGYLTRAMSVRPIQPLSRRSVCCSKSLTRCPCVAAAARSQTMSS